MTTGKIQIFHGQNGQPFNSTGCLWMSVVMVKFKGVMVMVSASPPCELHSKLGLDVFTITFEYRLKMAASYECLLHCLVQQSHI